MSVFYSQETIIYGLSVNSFLPFKVADDVLAKVRKNFFEHSKRQSDKLIQNIGDISIKYSYNLEKNKPMKWKVLKNKKVIEESAVTSVNTYEIRTYDDSGNKIFTTEYTNEHIIKKTVFALNGETVVLSVGKEKDMPVLSWRSADENKTLFMLEIDEHDAVLDMLSKRNPFISVTALTNKGVVYFGTEEELKKVSETVEIIKAELLEASMPTVYNSESDRTSGFNFNDNDFNIKRNMNKTYDIDKSEFFCGQEEDEESGIPTTDEQLDNNSVLEILPENEEPNQEENTVQITSENIVDADNTAETIPSDENVEITLHPDAEDNEPEISIESDTENEPALIINETSSDDTKDDIIENAAEQISEKSDDNIVIDYSNLQVTESKASIEEKVLIKPDVIETNKAVVTPKVKSKPTVTPQIAVADTIKEIAEENEFDNVPAPDPDAISPDLIINSAGERYLYFGELNDNLVREGYGRTQMTNGKTAYEGEYHNNKRNGFGSFYYRDGGLCYTGEWKENKRNGFGIGLRSSDGSYHAGKWTDNKPNGVGARFDKYGNLSYVSNFKDGREKGLAVEFESDGSISIFRWVNDEKKIIQKIFP